MVTTVTFSARRKTSLKDLFEREKCEIRGQREETPVLWPPHVKSWLIGKDSDAGRDWGHEEKGMTEDEMAGRHRRLDGQEFGWTQGVGDGQGGLACCYSWGRKHSDTTEQLNWTELNWCLWSRHQKKSPIRRILHLQRVQHLLGDLCCCTIHSFV